MNRFIFIGLVLLFSCQNERSSRIPEIAAMQVQKNRSELRKIIDHYSQNGDSLKLRAAFYLIENMDAHYFFGGKELNIFNTLFDEIGALPGPWSTKLFMDSIELEHGPIKLINTSMVLDIDVITAREVIENIDVAFHAWRSYPWAKDLSFDEFCSYVLPYRSANEPLNIWRKELHEKYIRIADTIRTTSRVKICSVINDDLKQWFRFSERMDFPGGIGIHDLHTGKSGLCRDMANLAIYSMRSIGIPVTFDYTPQWGNFSSGHSWNGLIDNDGSTVMFMGAESSPGEVSRWSTKKIAKVFRKTYTKQVNTLLATEELNNIPKYFRTMTSSDVTSIYTKVSDVHVNLRKGSKNYKNAFLCIFTNLKWNAISWSPCTNLQSIFSDMGRDIVYLPMYYANELYEPAGFPFILQANGDVSTLEPNSKKTQILNLNRMYPLVPKMVQYADLMIGAKFQGSDHPSFKEPVDIYTIEERPIQYLNEARLPGKFKFRYVRYYPLQSAKHSDLAELEFLNNHSVLSGKIIGTDTAHVEKSNSLAENAFDGDWATYFASNRPVGSWIGLDFGGPKEVSSIRYLPRNDANMILKNNIYELFYWDNSWISLGKVVGKQEYIVFENAPSNALFCLRNVSSGNVGRIFTYEAGKQVWW